MRNMEFFQGVPQFDVPWHGRSLCMPPFYYDVMMLRVQFLAPADRVRAILPSRRLYPYRITPWHSAVVITALAYRDSDVGPYH